MTDSDPREGLSLQSKVRPNGEVLFQEVQGEAVLLDLDSGMYFGLDPVGLRIWQLLAQHESLAGVVSAIVSEFDVSEERCAADLLDLVETFRNHNLVSIEQPR